MLIFVEFCVFDVEFQRRRRKQACARHFARCFAFRWGCSTCSQCFLAFRALLDISLRCGVYLFSVASFATGVRLPFFFRGRGEAGWGDGGRAPLAPAARGTWSTQTRNTGDPKKHWRHGAPGTRYWNAVSESWGTGDPGTVGALGHLGHVGPSGTGHQAHRAGSRHRHRAQSTQEISFEGREALSTKNITGRHRARKKLQSRAAQPVVGALVASAKPLCGKNFLGVTDAPVRLVCLCCQFVFFFYLHHELCCPEHLSFMDA